MCGYRVDEVASTVLSDVLSVPQFLVVIFFSNGNEFQVGILTPEEFRWKIVLSEDLQPLVVLNGLCHLHGKLLVIH